LVPQEDRRAAVAKVAARARRDRVVGLTPA